MQVLAWFGLPRALGSDLLCPGFHFFCVSFLACLAKQRGVSIQRLRHVRMFWPQVLLPDRHHSLVEGLSLGVLALIIVEQRQVAQTYGHVEVFRPEALFLDCQHSLKKRLGLGIFSLSAVKLPQTAQGSGRLRVLPPP